MAKPSSKALGKRKAPAQAGKVSYILLRWDACADEASLRRRQNHPRVPQAARAKRTVPMEQPRAIRRRTVGQSARQTSQRRSSFAMASSSLSRRENSSEVGRVTTTWRIWARRRKAWMCSVAAVHSSVAWIRIFYRGELYREKAELLLNQGQDYQRNAENTPVGEGEGTDAAEAA